MKCSVAIVRYTLTLSFILLFSHWSTAGNFLPPDQAFIFSSQQNQALLTISWEIEPGYYLYQDRIHVYPANNDETQIPLIFQSENVIKNDKNFGEVAVFSIRPRRKLILAYFPLRGITQR